MRNWIEPSLVLAFLGLAAGVGLAGQQFPVQEVADGDGTVQTIWVCSTDSGGSLDVTNATSSGTINGAFAVETYNPATSTSTINCGLDVMVSTAISNAWHGRELVPGTGITWQYRQGTATGAGMKLKKVYCMTQNAAGCTRLTVTQFK